MMEHEFTPLIEGTLEGWRMAGRGSFSLRGGEVLESAGGPGIFWYTLQAFADFLLRVEWRVSREEDNSGIFVRCPALGSSDPVNDWKPAVEQGYEIQIDDKGHNHELGRLGDPQCLTGAVYKLAPALKLASQPVGQWNVFEIEVEGEVIAVRLNTEPVCRYSGGSTRRREGYIGLQAHDPASRVQFRRLLVKSLR